MNSNTRFEQCTTKALREHKNCLGREQYARRMTRADEKSVAEGSESLHERRNRLAREARVRRLAKENIDESEQRRNIQRQALAKRTTEQVELHRKKQKESKNRISNAARIENYNTKTVSLHNIGSISIECPECKALHWIDEKVAGSQHAHIFSTCCAKGKVKLPVIASPPELLEMLLTEESPQAHDFRKKIRIYNSILAFTSMGAKIDEHVIGTQDSLSFNQIYMYDTNDQLQQRQLLMPNLNPTTFTQLQTMLHEVNPYTHIFRRAAHVLQENPIQDLKIVIVKTRHERQYTIPTASEVAVLMVEDSQEVKPSNRDIILYKKGGGLQRISEIHHSYSSLYYVLLFPYGDSGWHPGIHINNPQAESTSNDSSDYNSKEDISTNDNTTRDYISMMQYYAYRLHLRIYKST
ncbi:6876_t:CDS:2 [Acaulospora morrowiae]|uniref:6876_t:CDS:1 n=1 Tax=Acaulospora morrowiae TaxID=94023 RepID=A0A9N9EW07_9GLOM|nr:6876_t:CDS:2 [Acaulospora morrowiae]